MYVCMYVFIFSITVSIHCYFVLVSRVQHGDSTITYFTKCPPPAISSAHLGPCVAITVLLAVFPLLYFTSLWPRSNYHFALVHPFTFFIRSLQPPLIWQPPVCCLCMRLFPFCLFILFFRFHTQMKSYGI